METHFVVERWPCPKFWICCLWRKEKAPAACLLTRKTCFEHILGCASIDLDHIRYEMHMSVHKYKIVYVELSSLEHMKLLPRQSYECTAGLTRQHSIYASLKNECRPANTIDYANLYETRTWESFRSLHVWGAHNPPRGIEVRDFM